jgi:biofilm PGA synthesis N-glycosyltransferase PgaC
LYPVCTAALWIAGGVLFRRLDEHQIERAPEQQWPGVTILIPAYNEAGVIATCVRAALALDYPRFEVLVLDDGSADDTSAAAEAAAQADPRCRVIHDPVNRGKAERLNIGFREAQHELVAVTDADTHVHPQALKFLVARLESSPLLAAVAGAPHVTNRGRLLEAMQVLEAASIIGLIRRTQSLTGRVGVVAGVLGLFRRDRVLAVGGYESRMATEDIDLTWKLLLAGWHTAYEPHALIGMQVPNSLRALWAQRKRWARGQGEVLHMHIAEVSLWRNHRMWLLSIEALASLIWGLTLAASIVVAVLAAFLTDYGHGVFGFGMAWGIAIALVATIQMTVALTLERMYDPRAPRALLLGALYPIAYWMISACAAIHSQALALVRGPREQRVVWDIPREQAAPAEAPEQGAPAGQQSGTG